MNFDFTSYKHYIHDKADSMFAYIETYPKQNLPYMLDIKRSVQLDVRTRSNIYISTALRQSTKIVPIGQYCFSTSMYVCMYERLVGLGKLLCRPCIPHGQP